MSFINLVRNAIRTGSLQDGQNVKIITFNYDGILESVLASQFANTERGQAEGWRYTDYIEIVHPHGICGQINQSKTLDPKQLHDWGQQISVVNEPEDSVSDTVKADRETAKQWIADANKVYAVGFAFSKPNCEMLGLLGEPTDKELYYCNFDGNVGVKLAAERCTIFDKEKSIHEYEGSDDRPISVEDWFRTGVLGEFSA